MPAGETAVATRSRWRPRKEDPCASQAPGCLSGCAHKETACPPGRAMLMHATLLGFSSRIPPLAVLRGAGRSVGACLVRMKGTNEYDDRGGGTFRERSQLAALTGSSCPPTAVLGFDGSISPEQLAYWLQRTGWLRSRLWFYRPVEASAGAFKAKAVGSPAQRSRKSQHCSLCAQPRKGQGVAHAGSSAIFKGGLFHHQRNEEHCIESQQSSAVAIVGHEFRENKKSRPTLGEKAPACGQSCPMTLVPTSWATVGDLGR